MLILTLVILLLLLIYKRHQHMSSFKRSGIPGPKPNFIFGNALEIVQDGVKGTFPKWTKKYGKIVGFYIGGRPQILITDFELIRRVMIKDFHIFSNKSPCIPGGPHPQPQLQKTLPWLQGDPWKQLRVSLSPSFSPSKLNLLEPLMMSSIDNLISELDGRAKSGLEFDIRPLMAELMFTSATKCIFGLNLSLNQVSNEAKHFIESTHPRLDKSVLAMCMLLFPSLTFIAHPLRVWWESFRFQRLWSPEGACYDVAKKIVEARRNSKIKTNDFLQILMNAKMVRSTNDMDLEMSTEDEKKPNHNAMNKDVRSQALSEEEIIANAMFFLLASFETTSVSLQFAIHNLVNHQQIQDKLRGELKKISEKGNGNIKFSDTAKIPLLNHIIKETLRMFPPAAPFTTRVADEDYEYEGVVIPKGTGVFIGVSSIHNDPTLWPEPDKFLPERFENQLDKLAFLSFGGG